MARAICVSIGNLYPQLSDVGLQREAAGLHNITHAWWQIDPETARGSDYVLGVVSGQVVSAYRITSPIEQWPTMPFGTILSGRRAIPSTHVSKLSWQRACGWRVPMYGPLRYVAIALDDEGELAQLELDACERQSSLAPV